METFFLPEGCGLGTKFMVRPGTVLIVKSSNRDKLTKFMRHAAGLYPPSAIEHEQFTMVDEKKKLKVFYKPKTVRINFDGTVKELFQSNGLSISSYKYGCFLKPAEDKKHTEYKMRRDLAN